MRRRAFLASLAAAGLLGPLMRGPRADEGGPFLLLYWAPGGWDQTFVFDPHFESDLVDNDPNGEEASAGALTYGSAASRPSVDRFFADHAEHAAIVNGMAVGSISHQKCTRLVLTGGRTSELSDFPTRIAGGLGSELVMPAIFLSGPRYPGTLGQNAVAFTATLSGIIDGSLPAGADITATDEQVLARWLDSEAARLDLGAESEDYRDGLSRMGRLGEEIDGLALADEAGFDEQLATAIQAMSKGLSQCAVIQGTTPPFGGWDTHSSNHKVQDECFEWGFDELARIMDSLDSAPAPAGGTLAENTLVLAMSEMGRTPVLNNSGGKDHWPYASLMAVGHGVVPGVYGATDPALTGLPIDLETGLAASSGEILTPQHLIAGLFENFGLEPDGPALRGPFGT